MTTSSSPGAMACSGSRSGYIRWVCAAYFLALTAGLLATHGGSTFLPKFAAGLGDYPDLQLFPAFVLLALLVAAVRWPIARWPAITALVGYAAVTELAQAVIPGRTADLWTGWPTWRDWLSAQHCGKSEIADRRSQIGDRSSETGAESRQLNRIDKPDTVVVVDGP